MANHSTLTQKKVERRKKKKTAGGKKQETSLQSFCVTSGDTHT